MQPEEPPDDERLLRQDGEPCIWMTAGLLAWRLCDRGFDCERCPLDAALQRGAPRAEAPAPPAGAPWEFRDDRRYHRSHAWARSVAPGLVRCGIDAFASQFAASATSVVLAAVDSRVERGHAGAWLIDDSGLLPLRAPVSGRVTARNLRVQCDPGLLARAPYDDAWLYEVCGDEALERQGGLLTAAQMRERSEAQMRRLRAEVAQHVEAFRAAVGPTLADGGEPLADLRRIVGAPRYRRLVLSYLG